MTDQSLHSFDNGTFTADDEATIQIDRVVRDHSLQVRTKIDSATVGRYAAAMEQGAAFPPIKVADVGGSLLLVDGWHRIEAAGRVGRERIAATIIPMSREAALWEAAKANLAHGLPLTRRGERTNVFRAYVQAGQHRKKRGYKSYREISMELQGLAAHTTIRYWMKAHFPGIAGRMGNSATQGNASADYPPMDPDAINFPAAMQALTDALNIAQVLQSEELRYTLAERTSEILLHMRAMPLKQPPGENPDF